MSAPDQPSGTDTVRSRREVLGALAGAGTVGVAGCLGQGPSAVQVLAAGSLAKAVEEYIGPAFERETDRPLYGEYYGSNALIRLVEDETKHPDVVVSADATLLRDRLYGSVTEWDVEFATNSLGIAYNMDTTAGHRLDDGVPWYEVAREMAAGALAIGDPDLDPLGYRAVQAFELAEREHDLTGLRNGLLETVYMEPNEPQLLAGVSSRARAAAVVYRNMAVDHDLPFLEFPDEYNFANPRLADHYATVEYTTDQEGYTAVGRPIVYNATVHEDADNGAGGRELVQFLLDRPGLLVDAGLTVRAGLPRTHGMIPPAIDP